MTSAIQHHKMIVSNVFETAIPRTGQNSYVNSRKIKMFEDPYFQQIWLQLLVEHKETFIEIANCLDDIVCIPIYCAHRLIEPEEVNLYNMIKELECNQITFNFFKSNFQNFQFKNKDLNNLLSQAENIQVIRDSTYQRIYFNPGKLRLHKFNETLETLERESLREEKSFQVLDELIRKYQLLGKLKGKMNGRCLTIKAYKIIQELISKNSELLEDFLGHIENRNLKYEIRHQYPELCQQFGKAEIDYLINDYLRALDYKRR